MAEEKSDGRDERDAEIVISTIPSVPQRLLCPGSSNHTEKEKLRQKEERKKERKEGRKKKEENVARKRGVMIEGVSTFDFRLRLSAYEGSFLFFFVPFLWELDRHFSRWRTDFEIFNDQGGAWWEDNNPSRIVFPFLLCGGLDQRFEKDFQDFLNDRKDVKG